MDSETNHYELAYFLYPSVPEGEVLTRAGKLSKIIEEAGGEIQRRDEPKKRKLAYEIKKQAYGYFGVTVFHMPPDRIKELDKKLKSESLLRFLIAEEVPLPRPQTLRVIPSRPAPTHILSPRVEAPEKPEEKLDLEALDKKLEEILGK